MTHPAATPPTAEQVERLVEAVRRWQATTPSRTTTRDGRLEAAWDEFAALAPAERASPCAEDDEADDTVVPEAMLERGRQRAAKAVDDAERAEAVPTVTTWRLAVEGLLNESDKLTRYGSPMAKNANEAVAYARKLMAVTAPTRAGALDAARAKVVTVPLEPTEEMMEAFYDGAQAAMDASFAGQKQPYGIAPAEWFPPAYAAMLKAALAAGDGGSE